MEKVQKKKIVIYGASGFGREVAWLIQSCDGYEIACFIDDDTSKHGTLSNNIPVMSLENAGKLFSGAFVAGGVGIPKIRQRLMEKAKTAGFRFETIVHPRIERSPWIEIGVGTVICAGSILTTNIILGEHVQINLDCTIGHDVVMDDYATLAPGVHVSGWVHFGKRVYVGTGAVIINGMEEKPMVIGDDAIVGAGACVTKSIPPGETWGGVPARPLQGCCCRGSVPPWPTFGDDEIEAVERVLRSGKVNQWTGTEVTSFEKECTDFAGVKYAVAVANGSVALELALKTLGIGIGDEVIVTCYTFIASAGAVVMRGAVPVMADIDPDTLNISADTVRAVISPRTRAIIAVHLAGMPCDMDSLLALAKEYDLKVIEDCAQAHGATYKGRPVGSLGDVAAFSFCQDKIMTTGGEGGMLTTNDKAIWKKAWAYKDHGKNYDSVFHKEHPPGFRWLHDSFGTNWRMTEMQAAIGRVQLRKLPEWTAIRQRNAAMLTAGFSKIPALRVLDVPEEFEHAYYKYYVFVRPEKLREGWHRDRVMNAIVAEGVPCFSGSCSEIYLEKAFVNAGIGPGRRLPAAREAGEISLMFLVHPTLGVDEMRDTCRVVEKILG